MLQHFIFFFYFKLPVSTSTFISYSRYNIWWIVALSNVECRWGLKSPLTIYHSPYYLHTNFQNIRWLPRGRKNPAPEFFSHHYTLSLFQIHSGFIFEWFQAATTANDGLFSRAFFFLLLALHFSLSHCFDTCVCVYSRSVFYHQHYVRMDIECVWCEKGVSFEPDAMIHFRFVCITFQNPLQFISQINFCTCCLYTVVVVFFCFLFQYSFVCACIWQ